MLWGTPLGERPWRSRIKDRLYHALYRRRVVSCFDTGEDLPGRFAADLSRYRPDAIAATATRVTLGTVAIRAGTWYAADSPSVASGTCRITDWSGSIKRGRFVAPRKEPSTWVSTSRVRPPAQVRPR